MLELFLSCCPIAAAVAGYWGLVWLGGQCGSCSEAAGTCCDTSLDVGSSIAEVAGPAAAGCGTCCVACCGIALEILGALGDD